MSRAKLLLVVLFAALAFGGTFECSGSSGRRYRHDDDDDARAPGRRVATLVEPRSHEGTKRRSTSSASPSNLAALS